ncbi:MAG: thermopsin family protease, partial [Candidatus Parvarchaeota archaeon]
MMGNLSKKNKAILVGLVIMILISSSYVLANPTVSFGNNNHLKDEMNRLPHSMQRDANNVLSPSKLVTDAGSNVSVLGSKVINSVSSIPKIPTHLRVPRGSNENAPWYSYYEEPAPMGIGFMGLSPENQLYNYSTSSFLGIARIESLETYNSSLNYSSRDMTFQLNVNLGFYNGNKFYDYWIQDVAFVNTSTNTPAFINNIWNFTYNSSGKIYSSTLSGNGAIYSYHNMSFYAYSAPDVQGNGVSLSFPYTLEFRVNATINSMGNPAVSFFYNDGFGWYEFDFVSFIFANNLS